jgi:ribosomal protein S18 acetylase RimI-like enzyme
MCVPICPNPQPPIVRPAELVYTAGDATAKGEIAAFCTIYYEDATRSAVCVLVGTAAEHQRRGLGRAVVLDGFRRLQAMRCTRAFATIYDDSANAFYRSVVDSYDPWQTRLKRWP